MRLFLGVDGGQSGTTALIGDETGRSLAIGRSGPCNHVKTGDGREKFFRAIRGSVEDACTGAGLDPKAVRFEAACLGFSGGPADKESLIEQIIAVERKFVTTDALIALSGATAGEPGIITIAGTGSISYGRNASGRFARAGGWGYIFGDEGGGFDLTRQALRAALRQEEGWGPPTSLRDIFLSETGAADMNDLLHKMYTTDFPRPKIASMSKLVDQAALAGDAVAHGLIVGAAQQLATITSAVRGNLFETGEPAFVAYVGGVYRSQMLLERFRMIVEIEDGNRVIEPRFGPAAGALIEAYRLAALSPDFKELPEAEK